MEGAVTISPGSPRCCAGSEGILLSTDNKSLHNGFSTNETTATQATSPSAHRHPAETASFERGVVVGVFCFLMVLVVMFCCCLMS